MNTAASDDRSRSATSSRTNASTLFFLLTISLWKLAPTTADPDLWGHVRFGLDTLAARSIVRVDPYSFMTSGTEWINHEWLSEVLFAFLYSTVGAPGLVLLKVLLGLGIVALVRQELIRQGVEPLRALIPLLLMTWALPMSLGTVRPQMFTTAAFAVTVWAICRRESGSRRSLWILPPVFVLWANLHGGFLAGVGILGVWLAARLITGARRGLRSVGDDVGPIVVTLLGTLVNPYGPGLWQFLLRTATVSRPEITEWAPIRLVSVEGAAYLALLGLTAGAILGSPRRKSVSLLAVYLCLALLPFMAIRHFPLFALGVVLVSARYLPDAYSGWFGAIRPRGGLVLPTIALVSAGALLLASIPSLGAVSIVPSSFAFPARAMAMIAETRSSSRLAVDFDWGEYAIWHAGPRVSVSIDGRRETVYSETAYAKNLAFMFGAGRWDALLDDHGVDLALVKAGSPVANLLRLKPGWSLIYEDPTAALFAANGSAIGAELGQREPPGLPSDGAGLSFP